MAKDDLLDLKAEYRKANQEHAARRALVADFKADREEINDKIQKLQERADALTGRIANGLGDDWLELCELRGQLARAVGGK